MFEKVRVYANCDDATIVWKTERRIPECRGFALERRTRKGGGDLNRSFVPTWVGFKGEQHKPGESRPSTVWPIQRYIWTDYLASSGQEVRYRVIPMVRTNGALVKAPKSLWSRWTAWIRIGTGTTKGFKAYFNRGIVAAQWLAKLGGKDEKALLGQDIKTKGARNRDFLGGELRSAMLYPSLHEGFGLPVPEAMMCGTPVVALCIPVLAEVLGNAGVYGPNMEMLSARLAEMMADQSMKL